MIRHRRLARQAPPDSNGSCRFIVSADDSGPCRRHTCGAPALPGSPYCDRHRLLCAVDPKTAAGARTIRDFDREAERAPALPGELAYLASIAVPELDSADEPQDIAACLDLGNARDAEDE